MSGETEQQVSGWTVDTLKQHREALERKDETIRAADQRYLDERDRRYTEVNIEKEKALKIKETADLAALGLAREIQTYKDEKANQLREQINAERGEYLSRTEYNAAHQALIDKVETSLAPLEHFMVSQQGKSSGIGLSANVLVATLTLVLMTFGVILAIVTH